MSVIKTTYPTEYSIKPKNPNIFGFNSNNLGGSPLLSSAVISFSAALGSGATFIATAGESITINGNTILFSNDPNWGELTSSGLSSLVLATNELYEILSNHPILKNQYKFSIIDDGAGFFHVLMISLSYSSNNDITISLSSGISNLFTDVFAGTAGYFGGNNWKWGVSLKVNAWLSDNNLMLNDNNLLSILSKNKSITLEKDWQGLILDNNNFPTGEKQIEFDLAGFLAQFTGSTNPFTANTIQNRNAFVRYNIEFGEYYANASNQTARLRSNEVYSEKMYLHASQLDLKTKPSLISSDFLRYWKRNELIMPITTNIDWLTNCPANSLINIKQTVLGAFIYKYHRFEVTEAADFYQNTQISLNYDLYFQDGTSILGSFFPAEIISYFTQYIINLSFGRIDYETIEATQGSLIERVVWRVTEFAVGILRVLTNDISFLIDNETRNYKLGRENNELVFLNTLFGYDSLYINTEILYNIDVNSSSFQKNINYDQENEDIVNNEVLDLTNEKTIQINLINIETEYYKYLGKELLTSKRIYFNREIYLLVSSDYELTTESKTHSLTLNLKKAFQENE